MRVVLISTYELGRQPFGLASPAAWLRADGHEVTVADLACTRLPVDPVEQAEGVAFFLPMHTATRMFQKAVERVRGLNPRARLCAYGLYAPLNERVLRHAGVETIIGGEFEQGLVEWARGSSGAIEVRLERLQFRTPDRAGLPPLGAYAQLVANGSTRRVGYTEASRGCKHLCRHCPVVPVYNGAFRVVQRDVITADIRQQVAAGAEHITFGDPDFFNGPGHAVAVVEALHREWPRLSFDVTIKVEHLLDHRDLLAVLRKTGCAFVTTAVESLDDAVLEKLAKGHTRAGFEEALRLMRAAELPMAPTFIPYTPWTTRESYRSFLRDLAAMDLAGQVSPIQLAIRLLIPEGSRLLELEEIRSIIQPFDMRALNYPWRHDDPWMDTLAVKVQERIKREERNHVGREAIFRQVWDLAGAGDWIDRPMAARATVPYLTEPWYC